MRHAVGLAVAGVVIAVSCSVPEPGPAGSEVRARDRGALLFERHCALCHGRDGRGDGMAAVLLFPPPRDFGLARFRLVSTQNGIPTNGDLLGVLRRGMPGSAMPTFRWLADDDLHQLVVHVRELAIAGWARDDWERSQTSDEPETMAEARARAREILTPGAPIEVGRPAPETVTMLQHGRQVFVAKCAQCHGPDGTGQRPERPWDEHGSFHWPRDFTAGIMKGGTSYRELMCRVLAGMPGSTMPPMSFEAPGDAGAVVAYVQSLLGPAAATRLVQRPELLSARHVAELPASPGDPQWRDADEVPVVLAPLKWRDGAVLHASVAAVHDGDEVAIRVRWHDATRDDQPARSALPDAVALQLAGGPEPPPFGMGSARHPTDLWHWRPFSQEQAGAAAAQVRPSPHGGLPGRTADVPLYHVAEPAAREVPAEGPESAARFTDRAAPIASMAAWDQGRWSVVLRRRLAPGRSGELALRPGADVFLALAIWNGSARDHGAEKSVTIWHTLRLLP